MSTHSSLKKLEVAWHQLINMSLINQYELVGGSEDNICFGVGLEGHNLGLEKKVMGNVIK